MPPAKTAPATRKRNGSLATPDEFQDIKSREDGRKFLEKLSLLCPPGEPVSNGPLSICLHQIAAMPGIPKQALNAIRSTALLLEEVEEEAINETVRRAFDSQITKFTSDMKLLVDDVNTKIDNHLKAALAQANRTTPPPASASHDQVYPAVPVPATSYSSVLINPPPHVNPKLAAREGIKARQFIIRGGQQSKDGRWNQQKLKDDINTALRDLGVSEGKIKSLATYNADVGTVIEADTDGLAKWMSDPINMVELCAMLGVGVTFRMRRYMVMAFNVPLNIDPTNCAHLEEINSVNDLGDDTIAEMRWAKPIERRSPNQKSAHLILSYSNPEAANRAISNGISICNKICQAERVKKEPLRCMKCQEWNHKANHCPMLMDRCGNCAREHKTADCSYPRSKRCVSCRSDNHASWSRECSVFLRKMKELTERHLENLMPFFPTNDPWTWSTGTTNVNIPAARSNYIPRRTSAEKGKQRLQPYNLGGTPIDCGNESPPIHRNGENWLDREKAPHFNWWDDNLLRPSANPTQTAQPTQPTQPSNSNTTVNDSSAAGPSNSIRPNA